MEARKQQTEINSKINKAIHLLEEASSEEGALLSNKFGDMSSQLRSNAEDMKDRTFSTVKEQAKAVDSAVHNEPWKAIGVAAAVGAVTGLLVGRRS